MTDSPRVIRTMSQKGEGFTVRRARDSSTMINERPSARSERTAVRLERQWRGLCSPNLPISVCGVALPCPTPTVRMAAPSVPFDRRYSWNSNVYYRFGAFQRLEVELDNGIRTLAVHGPNGELVPDNRQQAKPNWVADPFEGRHRHSAHQSEVQPL